MCSLYSQRRISAFALFFSDTFSWAPTQWLTFSATFLFSLPSILSQYLFLKTFIFKFYLYIIFFIFNYLFNLINLFYFFNFSKLINNFANYLEFNRSWKQLPKFLIIIFNNYLNLKLRKFMIYKLILHSFDNGKHSLFFRALEKSETSRLRWGESNTIFSQCRRSTLTNWATWVNWSNFPVNFKWTQNKTHKW